MRHLISHYVLMIFFSSLFFSGCESNETNSKKTLISQTEKTEPEYGGTINVAHQNAILNPLSFNQYDWVWKTNQDQPYLDHLIRGDLQFGPRGSNENTWEAFDWVPPEHFRGDLAENWTVKQDPLRLVFNIRKGIYWPGRDGVMEKRELTADDIVYFYNHMWTSPRRIPTFWDFVQEWKATDKHTVVAYLNDWNANWAYRMAWGFFNGIAPPEVLQMNDGKGSDDWRLKTGTGPFQVADISPDDSQTYVKNSEYWDKEIINGVSYDLPFVDTLKYHIMSDEAAQIAAIRTCKIDILENFRWQFAEELRRSAPDLIIKKRLNPWGTFIALRNDKPPFNDVRVRRAMNLAVNQEEILSTLLNGDGEMLDYPFSSNWEGLYTPVTELPESGAELFSYNPEKAKSLLAEAGYPDGFEFDMQFTTRDPYHIDLMAMLEGYYQRIGVKVNAIMLDYPTFRAKMRQPDQAVGYLMNNSEGNPFATLRKSFVTGQTWNPSMHSDEKFDREYFKTVRIQEKKVRDEKLKELNIYIISERVPIVWLPTITIYQAWWPYVRNYWGELAVGAIRAAPIYARIWIDQDLKREFGCN